MGAAPCLPPGLSPPQPRGAPPPWHADARFRVSHARCRTPSRAAGCRGAVGSRVLPTRWASMSSPFDRSTSVAKPSSENRAPSLPTVLCRTCWSPRVTRTSVTDSLNGRRREIASRCSWLFSVAFSIRAGSSRRSDRIRIGPATSMALSKASTPGPSWAEHSRSGPGAPQSIARAVTSMSATSRKMTLSKKADLLIGEPVRSDDEEIGHATTVSRRVGCSTHSRWRLRFAIESEAGSHRRFLGLRTSVRGAFCPPRQDHDASA